MSSSRSSSSSGFSFIRRALFWTHLVAGVSAGVVILIMSVTGVALTYQRQMQLWADTRGYVSEPDEGAMRLPLDELLDRAGEGDPEAAPTSLTLRREPAMPVAIALDGRTVYLNAYSGQVLGEPRGQGMRRFFSSMVSWHRYVAMSGEGRATGKALTGAANLLFLFIVLTGFYLWWPRSWTWTQFTQVLWFRRTATPKARDFNWHNVLGFWSALPLAVVVASATVISYPWASNLVYTAAGEAPPAGRGRGTSPVEEPSSPDDALADPPYEIATLESMVAVASAQVPDWEIITMRLPASIESPVTLSIDRGDGGQPQLRGALTIDPRGLRAAEWEGPDAQTTGRQWRSWMRFAHTGEVYGLAGQTIAGLVSAVSVVLVWTGLSLALRRLAAWISRSGRRRRAHQPAEG